jgi:CheY-like chemotaxis protein
MQRILIQCHLQNSGVPHFVPIREMEMAKPPPFHDTRQQLEKCWRSKLEEASNRYGAANAECTTMRDAQNYGAKGATDAADVLTRTQHAQSLAVAEDMHALRTFTDLTNRQNAPEDQLAADPSGQEGVRETVRISVVDDDESVRDATNTLLRSVGYLVQTFASAESFLASGALRETQCLILDVRMPGIDGLELQRRLNAEDFRVPIIFISAHNDNPLRRQVIEAGAVDLLNKPFAASTLLATLEAALGGPSTS